MSLKHFNGVCYQGRRERGFVLPLALIVLALLTVLSLGLSQMARDGVRTVSAQKQIAEREVRLRSAAQWVIYQLLTGDYGMQTVSNGDISLPINGEPFLYKGIEVRVQDAAGLLGLAFYHQQTFQRLLENLGYQQVAATLSARLEDWIDSDQRITHGGGEMSDYLAKGLPMIPRNAPIRTIDELLDVPGFTPEIFNGGPDRPGLRDLLMAGGEGYFNLATAPAVLIAPVLNISSIRAARMVALRNARQWDKIRQMTGSNPLFQDVDPFRHGYRFRIHLHEAGSEAGAGLRMEVKLQPAGRVPYGIMLWQYPDHERG